MKLHNHSVIPSLDGLRAVSILIVFFAHARVLPYLPGGFGVTVFFFLSGYLITTLFFRESDRTGGIDMKAFYIRRLLRLSPPLFGTLILAYLLVALGLAHGEISGPTIASQALYYYNYYSAYFGGEGVLGLNVLWSLSVEEHFYLVYPWLFLLLLAGRLRPGHLGLMLAGILVWRLIRIHLMGTDAYTVYVSTDTRFDSILYGALLAILAHRGQAGRLFPDRALPRLLILGVSAAVLLFCFLYRDPAFRETFRYSLQGLALMPVFHYAVTRPDLLLFRPLNWAPMRLLGFYSYTVYLAHTVVLGLLYAHGVGPANPLLHALLALAICLAYAWAMHRFIEQPVKGLRRRLTAAAPPVP